MAITIGAADFPTLTAQPFGYEETETRAGQTARKWLVTGLLSPSEWLSLLDVYDGWRDTRIDDELTETSEVVGTTIGFTGDGPGGQSWTSVACWFITAPAAEQLGTYLSVTVELVDANQALAVLIKSKEEDDGILDYGPITIGSTSFPSLTAQPFGYEETETRAGYTARKWLVTGILTPAEWLSLLGTYDGWRDTRIEDEPTEISEVVGTTIAFSGTGAGGQSWTSVACWFITAPTAEQSGANLSVTVELVDANEALEVLIKTKETEQAADTDILDYGGITIGATSFPNLTAQPFGYEETETRAGYTAKKWLVKGTLTPAEWLSLLSTYDGWRDTRIEDPPAETSEVVGTTISFSGSGPGGQSWSGVACWFIGTPTAEQSGDNLSATVELVDANEALEVLIKNKEAGDEILEYGAVTIGGTSFPSLTAQPFGYEETDTRAGYTARKWLVTGPLTPAEWLSLLGVYDGWRDDRIEDEPTATSGIVGTTIDFSGEGPGGQSWSDVACWFIKAPTAEQSGANLSASVELVDANEALEVLLKAETSVDEDLPDLGTITVGSTVLTLLKPVDAYATSPSMELTATGAHYIQGALVPYKIKDVEGTTDLAGWDSVRAWYESQITAVPLAGSYFPITSPVATAENKVIAGIKTVQYTISIQLGLVL